VEGILLGQPEDDNMPVSISTMEKVTEKSSCLITTHYSLIELVSLI